jgi:exosortase
MTTTLSRANSRSTPMHLGGQSTAVASYARVAIAGGLLLLVYWGSIKAHLVQRWLTDGNWSHGWLIPLFSLYFLYLHRDTLGRCTVKPNYWGAVVLAASLALYFISAWRLRMAYPQALSLVGSIFGLTLLLGGWEVIRIAWFPIAFLILAVPLPERHYVNLTMPLREWASSSAAAILPLLVPGLYTEAQAVVIDYVMPGRPPGTLNVEEACSGMRLMMAFVTLGVAMAYLNERPLWQRIVMILSCLPIAVFCNTIRVTTTGLFYIFGDTQVSSLEFVGVTHMRDLAVGTPHQLLGIFMLGIALGLYALIGYVLKHLLIEDRNQA